MDPSGPVADAAAFYIQETGAALFGVVFLFLWLQSRAVYFGLWSVAWLLRLIAAAFSYQLFRTAHPAWLAPYAVFEFGFVIVLISAARAGFGSAIRDWRTVLRLIAILPIFVALVWAFGLYARLEAYHVCHALALGIVYIYNFVSLRRASGLGAKVFRFSLLVLAFAFLEHAGIFLYLYNRGNAAQWTRYLHNQALYDFALHCVLAFAAMAMWSESQIDRIRELDAEVDHLRRQNAQNADLDHLTGLLNQAALAGRVEGPAGFEGVIAVCDMDNFKDINDSYGHLVGDEILRNIGHLLRSSIRHQDEAFRWGGDEFVILFHGQREEVAAKRMSDLEARLRDFRVRGIGALPISFSWGIAEAGRRPLRDALDEADRAMYGHKRKRNAGAGPNP